MGTKKVDPDWIKSVDDAAKNFSNYLKKLIGEMVEDDDSSKENIGKVHDSIHETMSKTGELVNDLNNYLNQVAETFKEFDVQVANDIKNGDTNPGNSAHKYNKLP